MAGCGSKVTPRQRQLRKMLAKVEVPDCACGTMQLRPVPAGLGQVRTAEPACKHVLSADHPLTLQEWALLLEEAWPCLYVAPGQLDPRHAHNLVTRDRRKAAMVHRAARKLALFHPEDVCESDRWADCPHGVDKERFQKRHCTCWLCRQTEPEPEFEEEADESRAMLDVPAHRMFRFRKGQAGPCPEHYEKREFHAVVCSD